MMKTQCELLLTSVDGASNDLMTAIALIRKCKSDQLVALHELADGAELHLRSTGRRLGTVRWSCIHHRGLL